MNSVDYLIISNTTDYSTDYVCYGLEQLGKRYLRVNRDRFGTYKVIYALEPDLLIINMEGKDYKISPDTLKSIYFRAPVFLRAGKTYSLEEQLYRSQWNSFIRNLIVFNRARWVNHPVATYRAENKLYQLKCAKHIGLDVPETYVGNSLPSHISPVESYVVKSLDTALFYDGNEELFTYSTVMTGRELLDAEIRSAPIILQRCLRDKVDMRVTVIGNKIFPVSITTKNGGIEGDWRKIAKDQLRYTPVELPSEVRQHLLSLMRFLKLEFGGVDLAFADGKYYFIEVNPTGEWGWLNSSLPIDNAIVERLTMEESDG